MYFFRQKICYLCARLGIIMSKIHSIIGFLQSHKIIIVLLIFVLLVGFIDSNSIMNRRKTWDSIKSLKIEIASYNREFESDSKKLNELKNNSQRVVEVARENYYMTRPNEDLYIVESVSANDK